MRGMCPERDHFWVSTCVTRPLISISAMCFPVTFYDASHAIFAPYPSDHSQENQNQSVTAHPSAAQLQAGESAEPLKWFQLPIKRFFTALCQVRVTNGKRRTSTRMLFAAHIAIDNSHWRLPCDWKNWEDGWGPVERRTDCCSWNGWVFLGFFLFYFGQAHKNAAQATHTPSKKKSFYTEADVWRNWFHAPQSSTKWWWQPTECWMTFLRCSTAGRHLQGQLHFNTLISFNLPLMLLFADAIDKIHGSPPSNYPL